MGSLLETLVSDLMTNPDASIRVQSAYDIGEYQFFQGIDYLKKALWKDSEALVRVACMMALHKLEGDAVTDELIKVYNEQKEHLVRFYAIDLLAKIGNEKAREELIKAMDTEEDEKIKELIVFSLARLKEKNAREKMLKILEENKEKPRILERAVEYFIYLKDKKVKKVIEKYKEHDYLPLKAKTYFYLAILGDKETLKAIENEEIEINNDISIVLNGKVYRGNTVFKKALKEI